MSANNDNNYGMTAWAQGDFAQPALPHREPLPLVDSGRNYSNRNLDLPTQLVLVVLALLLSGMFGAFLLRLTGSQPLALFGGLIVFAVSVVIVALLVAGEWSPSFEAWSSARSEDKRTGAWHDAIALHYEAVNNAIMANLEIRVKEVELQQLQIEAASTDQWVRESLHGLLEERNMQKRPPASTFVQATPDPARAAAVAWLSTCYAPDGFNAERVHANGKLISVPWSKRGDWRSEPWRQDAINLLHDSGVVKSAEVNGVTVYSLTHDTGSAALAAVRGTRK